VDTLVGKTLSHYKILAQIGAGGMGVVYRAHDEALRRDVAVKVLPAAASTDPDRLRRFEQEARAAGALNHPNILAIYEFGEHEGSPYVVSELLEGKTLREQMGSRALPVRKVVEYGIQIARGLSAAHEKRIVHRDLKPENIFVTSDGRVKILDFGIAKLLRHDEVRGDEGETATQSRTEAGVVLGTTGYMSPEQVRGEPADHRSDLFALGAVRDALGSEGVRGSDAGGHDECDPDPRSAVALNAPRRHSPGPGPNHLALPGEEPSGAVPDGVGFGV
jgi:serine/threonine protein kinase